jgi:hypothetical protein
MSERQHIVASNNHQAELSFRGYWQEAGFGNARDQPGLVLHTIHITHAIHAHPHQVRVHPNVDLVSQRVTAMHRI